MKVVFICLVLVIRQFSDIKGTLAKKVIKYLPLKRNLMARPGPMQEESK